MQFTEIGQHIAQRRTELELTQGQLAKLAGLSRLTINQLESGRIKDLGVAKLIALLNVLGLELTTHQTPHRHALRNATAATNVSYRNHLSAERLTGALASGELPEGYEAHMSQLLDEAPLRVVVEAVEEAAEQTGVRPKAIWKHLAAWSRELHLYRQVWQ